MDNMLEHPDITRTLATGYPGIDPEPPLCLICGEPCEKMYRDGTTHAILGCNLCIEEIDPLEDL